MKPKNLLPVQQIQNRIFTIRGMQVMLDKDIASIYEIRPIRLREQVQRNLNRFPEDFMFRLNDAEVDFMVSQNAIPSRKHLGGSLPYVFTEQGIASLSGVIKSQKAAEIHINIMRAFIEMRRFIISNASIFQRLDRVELKQIESDQKFNQLFKALEDKGLKPKQGIFYDGQIYDAYTFISDLIRSANKSIVLIDNYMDDTILTLLTKRKKNVDVTVYTKQISKQLKLDLTKHNAQYPPIEIKTFKPAHDRFLIIDNKHIYHFGASLKDLGKKWFAFSKMEMSALEMLNKLKG